MNTDMPSWINTVWEKADAKLLKVQERTRKLLPYTTDKNGKWEAKHITWWTNGFYPAMMWLMYVDTKKEQYKDAAICAEELLSKAFDNYDGLHHDVGFMWHISSGVHYRLLEDGTSKNRVMTAAALLASRYNIQGEFIRAWNADKTGWAIIDSMMNIPLLYFASKETDDPRFAYIARKHADKTMNYHVRPDGSVHHIVNYDPVTGELLEAFGGQGFSEGSSWTRGQAWAIYGFVLSYIYTQKTQYLDTAKRVANYFIAALPEDCVPRCDFRSPAEPVIYDTSAGVIAACGLLEISNCVPELERELYRNAAVKMVKAVADNHCDFSDNTDNIVLNGTEAYHSVSGRNIPLIYGDYYFLEALYKLRGNDLLFW